jgi:hypothetical protein
MKAIIIISIIFLSACAKSPYPIRAKVAPFKGENPFMVELTTGQDRLPIKPNSYVTILGPLEVEKGWPIAAGTDTGYLYPKFLE